MARKSAKIGNLIKGFLVLDSKHFGNDTSYFIRCETCGKEFWKSSGFLKGKAICPFCEGGRNYRNVGDYNHERLYARYRCILRRVKSRDSYKKVGICAEWENDYKAFREWALNNGYDDSLTIDRIDNEKGYTPENCRWVTIKGQANNRKNNVVVKYEGRSFTLSQLAEYVGLPASAIHQRYEAGWSIEDIARTPYKGRKKWSETI